MHGNAVDKPRLGYAAHFGRGGSPARHMVKLLMGALMILGMATQAQAVVEQEAPIPGACFSSSQIIGCTPSVRLVADTSCLTARGGSPINITRIDFTTWSTDCQLGGTFRIIGSVSCPVPTVNPTVPYSYNANTSMCEREVATCTVDPLPELPKDDACAQSLEKGRGVDVDNACTAGLTEEMKTAASCVANKITKLALTPAYTKPSATYRSEAYQNHLLNVWKKRLEIKNADLSNEEKQACAAVISDVNTHMANHGIDAQPSNKGAQAPHVLGRAIDIPRAVADAMIAKVTGIAFVPSVPDCFACGMRVTSNVQDYINSATDNPPACNLRWGGMFTPYDPVHFQLPAN